MGRRHNDDIIVEQIIDRHIRQFLSEKYLRQEIRDIIYEERYILNEGAFSILKIAENWPKIVKGVGDIIDFCKGSTKFEKLKNAVTTATSGNPFKVIKWFLGSEAEMQKKIKLLSEIEEKYARTKHAGEKMACDIGGYAFDAAFASDFKALAKNLSLLKNLLLDVAGCFGPVGEGVAMLATAFESFLKDCVFGNERDFGTIAYNMADSIVQYEFNLSISQIYNKALEIGTAIKNVARNALSYICRSYDGFIQAGEHITNAFYYGGEAGQQLNSVNTLLLNLKGMVNTMFQNGTINVFCRAARNTADAANNLKGYLTKFINVPYPTFHNTAGSNPSKGDGTLAKAYCDSIENATQTRVLEDNNILNGYWQEIYTAADTFKSHGYNIEKWISQMALEMASKQIYMSQAQRKAYQAALEGRLTERIIDNNYSNVGKPLNYSYVPQPDRPPKGTTSNQHYDKNPDGSTNYRRPIAVSDQTSNRVNPPLVTPLRKRS